MEFQWASYELLRTLFEVNSVRRSSTKVRCKFNLSSTEFQRQSHGSTSEVRTSSTEFRCKFVAGPLKVQQKINGSPTEVSWKVNKVRRDSMEICWNFNEVQVKFKPDQLYIIGSIESSERFTEFNFKQESIELLRVQFELYYVCNMIQKGKDMSPRFLNSSSYWLPMEFKFQRTLKEAKGQLEVQQS